MWFKKKPGDDLLSRNSSTIGAEELNFRVRDGNGWNLFAMITRRFMTKQRTHKQSDFICGSEN